MYLSALVVACLAVGSITHALEEGTHTRPKAEHMGAGAMSLLGEDRNALAIGAHGREAWQHALRLEFLHG